MLETGESVSCLDIKKVTSAALPSAIYAIDIYLKVSIRDLKILMQKFNNESILFIFIKSCFQRASFRSYNKMTIVRVKLVKTLGKTYKMLPSLNFPSWHIVMQFTNTLEYLSLSTNLQLHLHRNYFLSSFKDFNNNIYTGSYPFFGEATIQYT